MQKEVLSLRLEPEIIKWIKSKTTKGKNKSEVVQELLHLAMQKEKLSSKTEHIGLQARATKASILTMVMLELFLKQTHEKGDDIVKKAFDIYQKDLESESAEVKVV